MIAIVGASADQLKALCDKTGCTVANVNSAAQQVLSGSKDAIAAAAVAARELGIKRAIPLATAGAFHSPFMASAREKLAPVLDTVAFSAPKFPVLSNVTGAPHSNDPSVIKATMLEQVTGTTNWAADVEAAKALGRGRGQTFFRIILPQTIKRVIPAIGNEVITLVKDTSLAFTMAVTEMFTIAKQLSSSNTTMTPLIAAGVFYYVFNFIVAWTMERIEKHYSYYN
jgi:acyl transferase domain-containing protein